MLCLCSDWSAGGLRKRSCEDADRVSLVRLGTRDQPQHPRGDSSNKHGRGARLPIPGRGSTACSHHPRHGTLAQVRRITFQRRQASLEKFQPSAFIGIDTLRNSRKELSWDL